ncbi:MAG: dockerin type I repeat-containing protein, partial [Muribaculaceae bacterium]|nr:dockerin type I repeat-containing protein [Muribaculaceae bacterium]
YGNFSQTLNGSLNRGFTAIGDKIYVAGRDENSANSTTYLAVYNGDTGEFTKRLDLGNEATVSFYPVNSVVTDDAGHLIVSNLVTNVSKNPLYLYQVNPLTGALTLRAALTCPEVSATPRIDHCDVAGDVESGNFVVFAPTSRGNFVIRWIFEDGVLVDTEALDVTQFYPANAGDFSTAPQIMAVDENTFYVDGASTYFARYDFDNGTLTGSLKGNTQLIPERAGGNGGTAFSTMGNNYMVYSYSDFAGSIGWRFIIAANHVDDEFANYTKCWILPEKGFGKLNNSSCCAQCVAVPTADAYVTRLYVYVPGNGLAAYDLRLKVKKGDVNADGVVNVIDVTMVINYVLGETDIPGFDVQAADAIGDGEIDVKDVTCIINIALGM